MINLIKAELFKLKRNNTFWVLVAIVTGLYTLINYLVVIDWWQMNNTGFYNVGLKEYNGLEMLKAPMFFNLIIATLAGFFINADYSTGTIKNQVLSGNKRIHIYLAKLMVFSLGSIITSVILPIITVVAVTLLLGHGDIYTTSSVNYLLQSFSLYTIIIVAYSSIVMFIASLTRESGKTIIISVIMTLILYVTEIFLVIKYEVVKLIYENSIFYQIYEAFNPMITSNGILKNIFISVGTTIVMACLGVLMFKRKEIK